MPSPKAGRLTLELIEENLQYWKRLRDVWNRCDVSPDDPLEVRICKRYIRLGSLKAVLDELGEAGLHPAGWTTKDLSDVIRSKAVKDEDLAFAAREVLAFRSKGTARWS